MGNNNELIKNLKSALSNLPIGTQISIAVTDKDNTNCFGLKKDINGIENIDNYNCAFEIGSVTKAFTGNILAQLVIEEKVKMDDQIQNFLPFTLLNNPPITLKQLAMHTSGLPRMPGNFEQQENYNNENPYCNYNEGHLKGYLTHELRLESKPGEKFLYSNLGSGLLSYIISKIEGKSFPNVVKEKIFLPLKMYNSSFELNELSTEMIYGMDENGKTVSVWDGGILSGCLGIISTAFDLSKFAKFSFGLNNNAVNLQMREIFWIRSDLSINLGWGIVTLPESNAILRLNGGTGGSASSIFINREKQKSLTLCSNIQPSKYMEMIEPLCIDLVK